MQWTPCKYQVLRLWSMPLNVGLRPNRKNDRWRPTTLWQHGWFDFSRCYYLLFSLLWLNKNNVNITAKHLIVLSYFNINPVTRGNSRMIKTRYQLHCISLVCTPFCKLTPGSTVSSHHLWQQWGIRIIHSVFPKHSHQSSPFTKVHNWQVGLKKLI